MDTSFLSFLMHFNVVALKDKTHKIEHFESTLKADVKMTNMQQVEVLDASWGTGVMDLFLIWQRYY